MSTTPEGRIKNKIKSMLDKYRSKVYIEMPVPFGYGRPSLDFIGSARHPDGFGLAFAIEAKRPGALPTLRQSATIERMQVGGVRVFVIDGDDGYAALFAWLEKVTGGVP